MSLRFLAGTAGLTAAILLPTVAVSAAPSDPTTVTADARPAATAPTAPLAPAVAPGQGAVTVTWTAPASSGASPITAYRVRVVPDGRTVTVAAPATSATVTGLADGTQVTATVVAINRVGTSAAAAAGSAIPVPPITVGLTVADGSAKFRDIDVGPDGTVYVTSKDAISRVGDDGATLTALPLGTVKPWTTTVAPNGDVFFVDDAQGGVDEVRRFHDGTVTTVAGIGGHPTWDDTHHFPTTDPMPALDAILPDAVALAVSPVDGAVFVLDHVGGTVMRFTVGGTIARVAGTPGNPTRVSDGDGGPATAAHINGPQYVEIDDDGAIYVAETRGDRVRRFTVGGTIETVAGNGTALIDPAADLDATATGMPAPARMVWMPGRGLLIDTMGRKRLLVDGRLRRIGGDAFDRALFDSPVPPGDGAIGANDNTMALAWNGSTLWGLYVVHNDQGWHPELRSAGPWLDAAEPSEHPGFGSWADLVKLHHRAFVDRAPTATELATWVTALEAGTKTPGQLDDALRRSADNTANVDPIVRLYRAFLGRAPDADGLHFWIARRRNVAPARTWRVADLAAQFTASSEFNRKYGKLSNQAFVTRIYTDVLDRPADTTGVDYWTKQLDTKRLTRARLVLSFSESTENGRKQAANTDVVVAYLALVGRMPTSAETTAWTTAAAGGATDADLLDDLVAAAPSLV